MVTLAEKKQLDSPLVYANALKSNYYQISKKLDSVYSRQYNRGKKLYVIQSSFDTNS